MNLGQQASSESKYPLFFAIWHSCISRHEPKDCLRRLVKARILFASRAGHKRGFILVGVIICHKASEASSDILLRVAI